MLKIIIDKHIPFLQSQLIGIGNAELIEPEQFTREKVKDADALIIRTRTHINKELLDGTKVRFVATATIGYDHIDTDYCEQNGIYWTACPGCNAQAVCDYVEEAINTISIHQKTTPTIGIIGVGNVGEKVALMAKKHGYNVLLNDPPKNIGVSLEEIAQKADIITFHTPLTYNGQYPTYHLCDEKFLLLCKKNAIIINAARGAIADEQALLKSEHKCVIDCWEGEPHINHKLLFNPNTLLASYHIAGYSIEGKMNASHICLNKLAEYFHLPAIWNQQMADTEKLSMPEGDHLQGWLKRLTQQMRTADFDFEKARKNYLLR